MTFANECEELRCLLAGCVSEVIGLCEVDSTNRYAKDMADAGAVHGTLVLADQQTAGRGRMKRIWENQKGTDIAMSLILRPNLPAGQVSRLTLLAAVAVCRAIERAAELPARIKWPNDVLIDDKKCCGILLELRVQDGCISYVVLGIGVNVNADLPAHLAAQATSLYAETGKVFERIAICADIAAQAMDLSQCDERGDRRYLQEYCSRSHTLSRRVTIYEGETVICGFAQGIDEYGRLLLRTDDGRLRTIVNGDVSLR